MSERYKTRGALDFLRRLGYSDNETAQAVIELCDEWYTGSEEEFHTRTNLNGLEYVLDTLNFAKRGCEDDANLCEIVEINAGEDDDKFSGVREILDENRFDVMYRRQLESLAATGTVGAYVRVDGAEILEDGRFRGGRIRINYVAAQGIIPLTVINDDITECAFVGYDIRGGKREQTLVVFLFEDGLYRACTYVFDAEGREQESLRQEVQLGDVRPFAIMRTADVNNLRDMEGYGLPKIYNAIPALKILDLSWNILYGDLDKGEKLLLINELLAEIKYDDKGNPKLTPQQKKLFILLGEKLPDQKSLIQEYNPEIRTAQIKEALELSLSMLSMSFGYGTKKYLFEGGQIKTATEYVGERQDAMQSINRQRAESEAYIRGIVKAVMWMSNTAQGTAWDLDEQICIEFDDTYITDRQTQLDSMRADALSFPDVQEFLIQYIMERLNCERDEAVGYINNNPEVDEEED